MYAISTAQDPERYVEYDDAEVADVVTDAVPVAARPIVDTQPTAHLHAVGAGYRDPTDVITGIFTIGSRTAHCLFDTGASTSFIATSFMVESGLSTVIC